MSLVLQILGGLLILFSIDSNIGLFRKQSLIKLALLWFKACPLIKRKPITLDFKGATVITSAGTMNVRSYKTPETTDEKVDLLFKKVEWLQEDLTKQKQDLQKQIESQKKLSESNHSKVSTELNTVKKDLESTAVGGLKIQMFGVNLLIYGAVVSYIVA